MYEPQFRPLVLNAEERKQLVRKAKCDALAYESAQLLARGEIAKAATLAGECLAIAGRDQFALWLRHYATTRFKLTGGAVDEFLGSMPPADVAI